MKSRGLYISLLFFILASLLPIPMVHAQTNYINVTTVPSGVSTLVSNTPYVVTDKYIITLAFTSNTYYRIVCYDKTTKQLVQASGTVGGGSGITIRHFAYEFFKYSNDIIFLVAARGQSSQWSDEYDYIDICKYVISTNSLTCTTTTIAGEYKKNYPHHAFNIVADSQYLYCVTNHVYTSYSYWTHIVLRKISMSNLAVTTYIIASYDANTRFAYIDHVSDTKMLIYILRESVSTSPVYIFDKTSGSITYLCDYPNPTDFNGVPLNNVIVLAFDKYWYNETTQIARLFFVSSGLQSGYARLNFASYKIFLNQYYQFAGQSATRAYGYPNTDSTVWCWGYEYNEDYFRVYYANIVAGQNKIYYARLHSLGNTTENSITLLGYGETNKYETFLYTSVSSTVKRPFVEEEYIFERCGATVGNSAIKIFFGLPGEYVGFQVSLTIEPDFRIEQKIYAEITYIITIYASASNRPLQNAKVELWDNNTGEYRQRVVDYTESDGKKKIGVSYDLSLRNRILKIGIKVSYYGEILFYEEWQYPIDAPTYEILVYWIEASKYDPKKTDYNFSEPLDTVLLKNTEYIFIFKVLKGGAPSPYTIFVIKWYAGEELKFQYTGKTDAYGLFKSAIISNDNFRTLVAEAYVSNIKVAEYRNTFVFADLPTLPTLPQDYPHPPIITNIGIASILAVLPALIIILVPAFAFYSVIKSGIGLLIGLNTGMIVAVLGGLIPMYLVLLFVLVDILYFMREIQK